MEAKYTAQERHSLRFSFMNYFFLQQFPTLRHYLCFNGFPFYLGLHHYSTVFHLVLPSSFQIADLLLTVHLNVILKVFTSLLRNGFFNLIWLWSVFASTPVYGLMAILISFVYQNNVYLVSNKFANIISRSFPCTGSSSLKYVFVTTMSCFWQNCAFRSPVSTSNLKFRLEVTLPYFRVEITHNNCNVSTFCYVQSLLYIVIELLFFFETGLKWHKYQKLPICRPPR